jgi:hypothetical protein
MFRFLSYKINQNPIVINSFKVKNNLVRSSVRWELFFKSLPINFKKQIIDLKLDDNDIDDYETKMALMYVTKSYGD